MRIEVIALDGVFDLGLSAVLDAFQTANELREASGLDAPPFQARITGVRRVVKTAQGFSVPVERPGRRSPACVVVPALGTKMPDPLVWALARRDVRDAAELLRQRAARGAMVA